MGTRLVDLSNAAAGSVTLDVPTEGGYEVTAEEIRSGGDSTVGDEQIDKGPFDLTSDLAAEDPLSVPLMLALGSTAVEVTASGRVAGNSTTQEFAVVHGVLIGVSLNLNEDKSGTVAYKFRNRGLTGTSAMTPLAALAQELKLGTGTAREQAVRGRIIQFAAGAVFTPWNTSIDPVALSLAALSLNADAQVAVDKDTGELVITQVDITGWRYGGSLTLKDQTIIATSGLSTSDYLAALGRGTLTVPIKMAGQGAAVPPVNQILTAASVEFVSSRGRLRAGVNYGSNETRFNCIPRSALGAVLTPAEMITFAAAA